MRWWPIFSIVWKIFHWPFFLLGHLFSGIVQKMPRRRRWLRRLRWFLIIVQLIFPLNAAQQVLQMKETEEGRTGEFHLCSYLHILVLTASRCIIERSWWGNLFRRFLFVNKICLHIHCKNIKMDDWCRRRNLLVRRPQPLEELSASGGRDKHDTGAMWGWDIRSWIWRYWLHYKGHFLGQCTMGIAMRKSFRNFQ